MKTVKFVAVLVLVAFNVMSAQKQASGGQRISIQMKWFHQFQFAGYYAAVEQGFYAAEGLDVELKERDPDIDHIETVVSGQAEYGVADSGLLLARMQGRPVVLVAQVFQYSPLVFLALQTSDIQTPFDLKNKVVMMPRASVKYPVLSALILKTLGNFDRVKWTEETYSNQDLIDGQSDVMVAYSTDQPFWFREKNVAVNLIDPRDYGIDFYGDNLFTSERELQEYPERVAAVRRATIKGWEYALAHPAEMIDLILEKYNTQNMSRKHLEYEAEKTAQVILPNYVPIGQMEQPRFRKVAETYLLLGLVNSPAIDPGFFYNIPQPSLQLSPAEIAWLRQHPVVRVGMHSQSSPFEFVDENGNYRGLAADYMRLVGERLGISFVVDPSQQNGIEVMPCAEIGEEHRRNYKYSKPYFNFSQCMVTRRDQPFSSISELDGRRVALQRGQSYYRKLLGQTQINPVVFNSVNDAFQAVARGDADAAIASLPAAVHAIKNQGLEALAVSALISADVFSLGFAVSSDSPLLGTAIDKALDSITAAERTSIQEKWMPVSDYAAGVTGNKSFLPLAPLMVRPQWALVWFLGFALCFAIVLTLIVRFPVSWLPLPIGLQETGTQLVMIVLASLFMSVLLVTARFGLKRLEFQERVQQGQRLEASVRSAHVGIRSWIENQREHAEMVAANSELSQLAQKLLTIPGPGRIALRKRMITVVEKWSGKCFEELFIVTPDFANVAFEHEECAGHRNVIAERYSELMTKAFSGDVVCIPPFTFEECSGGRKTGLGAGEPTFMAFASPLAGDNGEIIAVMILCFRPEAHLLTALTMARTSRTHEMYAFSQAGNMLSESRFAAKKASGDEETSGSVARVRVTDPGGVIGQDEIFFHKSG